MYTLLRIIELLGKTLLRSGEGTELDENPAEGRRRSIINLCRLIQEFL
jgi:hypothetical protein